MTADAKRSGVILALMIALAGCGAPPPGFAGAWVGTAVVSAPTCSDGSKAAPQSGPFGAQITEAGTTLSFPVVCSATLTFTVEPSGTDATQQGTATCPPNTQNGSTFVVAYSNGTLRLSDEILFINLDDRTDASGTITGTCTLTVTGMLTRQP